MGSTPVCQITAAGIVRPDYAACLGYFQGLYRSIYGQDVYLGADCQDGQFMALLANALHDANGEAVAVYNAFSPATAQGAGLSSVVKINGIRRKSATYSTADVLIVGQVGAEIVSVAARDQSGNLWSLPDSVIIPPAGQITVTATCQTLGAVAAPSGAIDTIATPTLGWQSVGNPIAAAVSLPIETDRQLRQRQALSTALPAQTILEALVGALFAVTGVTRVKAYENDTNLPDGFTGARRVTPSRPWSRAAMSPPSPASSPARRAPASAPTAINFRFSPIAPASRIRSGSSAGTPHHRLVRHASSEGGLHARRRRGDPAGTRRLHERHRYRRQSAAQQRLSRGEPSGRPACRDLRDRRARRQAGRPHKRCLWRHRCGVQRGPGL